MAKIHLKKDKTIKRKQYDNKYEYKFDKNTNLVPKKTNKLICIMFSEDRGANFILRKYNNKNDTFRFNKGLYIIDNESIHVTKNSNRICFYMEGISTPLKLSNIEKYTEEMNYIDLDGQTRKTVVQKIKGLKFDSKILDLVCDRKLAENFTQSDKNKNLMLILLILGIVSLIGIFASYGVIYYFR